MAAFATNRKARFEYDIKNTLEAGIVLSGWEVKSVREGKVRLAGSYIIVRGGEAFLINTEISPYQPGNIPEDDDPARNRKLLLKKDEIAVLAKAADEKMSAVPLSLYSKGRVIKVEIGIGRSRKQADKREVLKKRDIIKEIGKRIK